MRYITRKYWQLLLEEQNAQQHGAVWTTNDHLPIVNFYIDCYISHN